MFRSAFELNVSNFTGSEVSPTDCRRVGIAHPQILREKKANPEVGLCRKLSTMAAIGKRNTLTVLRESKSGIYLDGGEHGEILLPNRYVPRRIAPGDRLEVFVYRDSEDRLVASTETPLATVGDVATLRVISVNRQIGAFLDLGPRQGSVVAVPRADRPSAGGPGRGGADLFG